MKNLVYQKVSQHQHDLMEQIYRLRYEVYGRENNFIDCAQYPDGIEIDCFDHQSQHFAAIDGTSGEILGTIRLILPGEHTLPVRQHCPYLREQMERIPGGRFAEMSRLVVSSKLRKRTDLTRACQDRYPEETDTFLNDLEIHCVAKCVTIGLCGYAFEESRRQGITHWFALMERSLWGLLRKYGFRFHRIGGEVNVFGPVYPYIVSVFDIEQAVARFLFRHGCPLLEPRLRPFGYRVVAPPLVRT